MDLNEISQKWTPTERLKVIANLAKIAQRMTAFSGGRPVWLIEKIATEAPDKLEEFRMYIRQDLMK